MTRPQALAPKPRPVPVPAPAPAKTSPPAAKTASKTVDGPQAPAVKAGEPQAAKPPLSKEASAQAKTNFQLASALNTPPAQKEAAPLFIPPPLVKDPKALSAPTRGTEEETAPARIRLVKSGPSAPEHLPGDGSNVTFKDGKIVVYDGFAGQRNFIDINADSIGDISHGDVVKKILESKGVPSDRIVPVNMGVSGAPGLGSKFQAFASDVVNQGNTVVSKGADSKEVRSPVSAVNLSLSTYTPLAKVAETLKLDGLTTENVLSRREEVRTALSDFAANNPDHRYADSWKFVQGIDLLTSKGIPVYVAGGNGGRGDLNLMSLGNGAVNVGATKPLEPKSVTATADGGGQSVKSVTVATAAKNTTLPLWMETPTFGTASNSLIQRYAPGYYPIRELKDGQGTVTGFNFTGGERVDIPFSQVYEPALHGRLQERFGETPGYRPLAKTAIMGTSFAAPAALGSDFVRFLNRNPDQPAK